MDNNIYIYSLLKHNFRLYIVLIFIFCIALVKAQTPTDAVDYSIKRGFYTNTFQLELSNETAGSTIRYTLDGSKPGSSNGQVYTTPLIIDSNAMVRAYASSTNLPDSKIKTHSYIFLEQVIRQENKMLEDYGYDYSSEETGKVFWTEEMDPEIVDADEYKNEIIQGFKDIPSLSVVMPKIDLWSEDGIYWGDNLTDTSDEFEKECSIEMIYPKGYKGDSLNNWQENCGIKIQGGGARQDLGTRQGKQSFTLVFRNIYGAGKLKNEFFADAPHGKESLCSRYDKIIIRAGLNKGWACYWDREKTVYTRDQLGRDLQILMSGFGSHGMFVHLYLNGKYWGVYNPCERPDHNFLANHLGGESEDYFYAKGKDDDASDDRSGEPGQSKTRFFEATSKEYNNIPFEEMQNWVMVDQSIASCLVHGYANPGDSPQYYYGNNNNPPGPVVWIPWDIEDSFDGGSRRTGPPNVDNMLDSRNSSDNGFKAFWTNIDFRMRFNDLVYKHFYNDGAMTDENVMKAWDNLCNYIYRPIVCESARWGDEWGPLMDRDNEWDAARFAVKEDLKGRGADFISKLQDEDYYSTLPAPRYSSNSADLTISREGSIGAVYYTTDGSDPRIWDLTASVSDSAIHIGGTDTTIIIGEATTIKARNKNGDEWSPLSKVLVLPDGTITYEVAKLDEILIPNLNPSDTLDPAITNIKQTDKLLLFPNPVSNKLFISKNKNYTVYSSVGILILNGKGTEIPMENLPDGLYIIIIDNESYKILKRD